MRLRDINEVEDVSCGMGQRKEGECRKTQKFNWRLVLH